MGNSRALLLHLLFCVVAIGLAAGCTDDDLETDAIESEVETGPPETVCTESDLAWSSSTSTTDTCAGPWAYQRYHGCFAYGTGASCGTREEPYTCYSCLHGQLGASYVEDQTVSQSCDWDPDRHRLTCGPTLANRCAAAAIALKGQILINSGAATATGVLVGTQWTDVISEDPLSTIKYQTCQITLTNTTYAVNDGCPHEPAYAGTCMQTVYNSCRSSEFGEEIGGCGTADPTYASGAGLTWIQAKEGDPYVDDASRICSTREHLAIGTPAEIAVRVADSTAVMNPAYALWTRLPATDAVEAAARARLADNLQILFEMKGDKMTPEHAAEIRARYATNPEVACGLPAGPDADCLVYADAAQLTGPMRLCQRLRSAHVGTAVRDQELPGCIALLEKEQLRGEGTCAKNLRASLAETIDALFAEQIGRITLASGGQLAGLDTVIGNLDAWSAAAGDLYGADQVAFDAAESKILAHLWKRATDVIAPLPATFSAGAAGTEAARAQLAVLFDAQLEASRRVLAAALGASPPLRHRTLVRVMADAFAPLVEKLEHAAPFYDLACAYRACTPGNANEATLLYRLIGSIGSQPELAAAITAAGAVRPEWRTSVFSVLRDRYAVLVDAYRDAAGDLTADPVGLAVGPVAPGAQGLAAIVLTGRHRWQTYAAAGRLLEHATDTLPTGLDEARRSGTVNVLNNRRAELQDAITGFRQARGDVANVVLQRIQTDALAQRADDELAVLGAELVERSDDLTGLRVAQASADEAHGELLASYTARASKPGWIPEHQINTVALAPFAVNAMDARWTSGFVTTEDYPDLAIRGGDGQPWVRHVAAGESLTFAIDGEWAPTCSLQPAIEELNGGEEAPDVIGAMTGPEGYRLAWESSEYVARSYGHSRDEFSTESETESNCAAAGLGISIPIPIPFVSSGFDFKTDRCRRWESGVRRSYTSTSTRNLALSWAANLAGGLRLEDTPFPFAPAGALVLVEQEQVGGAPRIRDAHVLGRNRTFVFSGDADVYLIVNDKKCVDVDTSALTVHVAHAQPAGAAASALATAMAGILADVRVAAAVLVEQGAVSGSDLRALEADAYDRLRLACGGCDLATYPETVRGMFEAWLAHELATIERRVRMVTLERELDRAAFRGVAIAHDHEAADSAGRVLQQMTRWQLGNLSGHHLSAQVAMLFEHLDRRVSPMIRLRYPAADAGIRVAGSGLIEALVTSDFMLPIEDLAARANDVAAVISAQLASATLDDTNRTVPLVLAFPKPFVETADEEEEEEEEDEEGEGDDPTQPPFPPDDGDPWPGPGDPVASLAGPQTPADDGAGSTLLPTPFAWNAAHSDRIGAVWEPIYENGAVTDYRLRDRIVLEVSPHDVYRDAPGGLFCFEAAPVIKRAALVFEAANNVDGFNALGNRRPARVGGERVFTHEDGPIAMTIDNPQWSSFSLRALKAASANTALEIFATHAGSETALAGMAPFGSFSVDIAPLITAQNSVATATNVFLVLEVEARGAESTLAGLLGCP
jgi:hypothetical protein